MISIQNILPAPIKETTYNPNSQVWNCSYELTQNTKYLIKAHSGKGKSTFLHSIYGLRTDYDGLIKWKDQNTRTLQEDDWVDIRQNQLSIVFQNLRLFPQLTAKENILINLHQENVNDQKIYEYSKKLGIDSLLEKESGLLSYGQQQRVAIIRAIMQPFQMLLLDEPFSHLDSENTQAAVELIINRCAEQKAGLILVSLGEDFGIPFDQVLDL